MSSDSTFVCADNEIHCVLRKISRVTKLKLTFDVFYNPQVVHELSETLEEIPDFYFRYLGMSKYILAKLSTAEKRKVVVKYNLSDATKIDLACFSTTRPCSGGQDGDLNATELLCFGVGALRPVYDKTDHSWRCAGIRWGKLGSKHLRTIRVGEAKTHVDPLTDEFGFEPWESTNLIYGDSYGELEQLWQRRSEAALLESLVAAFARINAANAPMFYGPPKSITRKHLALGLWSQPPRNRQELIVRVQTILQNTKIDGKASAILVERPKRPERPKQQEDSESWRDDSGHDGWLRG